MKTTRMTALLVGCLLASALLCIGIRETIDAHRRDEALRSRNSGNPERTDRAAAGSRSAEGQAGNDRGAMLTRLRTLLSSGTSLEQTRGFLELIQRLQPGEFAGAMADLKTLGMAHWVSGCLLLTQWAEVDPESALSWALSEPDAALVWQDGEASPREPGDYPPYTGDAKVLKIWLKNHPAAAMAWAAAHDAGTGPSHTRQLWALDQWASRDPAAALAWVDAQPKASAAAGTERLVKVLGRMAATDLPQVIALAAEAGADQRSALISGISMRIGAQDTDSRRRWLDSIPDGDLKDVAVAAMISGMQDAPVDERLALLQQHPGAANKPGVASIYREWVNLEPDAAMTSLKELSPGPLRDESVRVAIAAFSGGDGSGAEAGLELMNRYPEAVDDITLSRWFFTAVNNSRAWELGLSQVPRVSNTRIQEVYYTRVLESWFRVDREAARTWVDHHQELPGTVREQMKDK